MQPAITLRSTSYNHEQFVVDSLESVARQDCGGFQWIIVDDASTDDTLKKIRAWLDRNFGALRRDNIEVELIAQEQNIGFAATLNQILEIAKGEYICGLSTDDRMLPHRISSAASAVGLLPEGYAGAYGDAYVIDALGHRSEKRFIERHREFDRPPDGELFETLLEAPFIPAPSAVVRRSALVEVGGYDESLEYEDYDMWLRLSRVYQFAYLDEISVEYRIHDGNMHSKISDWRRINYWIFRKHLDHEAGARRFVGNLKSLQRRGGVSADIIADLRKIDLAGESGWEALQRSLTGEVGPPCAPSRRAGFWRRLKGRFT